MDVIGGEMVTEEKPSSGLLSGILEKSALSGLGVMPKFAEREIVVEMTESQLRQLLLQNADDRAKNAVTIELHEGKLSLKIRLW